jgi:hypothetical protein
MEFATGDVVRAETEISPSSGFGHPVPIGTEGVVSFVYPPGVMVSPYDGQEYALKVHFPGRVNICRCFDGGYHVGDFEISKIEVTDDEIATFLQSARPESEAA